MRGLNVINGDLVISDGDLVWLEDDILVSVNRRLTTRLSEFFLDVNMGLDHDDIFIKRYSEDRIKQEVSDCVMQEERVNEVYDIKVDVNGRHIEINFRFSTERGEFESEVMM